jgi:hypothetical protein
MRDFVLPSVKADEVDCHSREKMLKTKGKAVLISK